MCIELVIIPVEVPKSQFGKVCLKQCPWTFQIVDVVFIHTHPHILYILSVDIWIVRIDKVDTLRLKYLKNNLRRPFENCDLTSLLYRITAMETSRHKHCNKKHAHTRCGRMWVCAPCLGQTQTLKK